MLTLFSYAAILAFFYIRLGQSKIVIQLIELYVIHKPR